MELKVISDIASVTNLVFNYVWHMRESLPLKVLWHQLKKKKREEICVVIREVTEVENIRQVRTEIVKVDIGAVI